MVVLTSEERVALEEVATQYGMTSAKRAVLESLKERGLLRLSGSWYATAAGKAALGWAS